MAQAATGLMQQASPAFEPVVPILSQLLKAEMAEREVRAVAYRLKVARFRENLHLVDRLAVDSKKPLPCMTISSLEKLACINAPAPKVSQSLTSALIHIHDP